VTGAGWEAGRVRGSRRRPGSECSRLGARFRASRGGEVGEGGARLRRVSDPKFRVSRRIDSLRPARNLDSGLLLVRSPRRFSSPAPRPALAAKGGGGPALCRGSPLHNSPNLLRMESSGRSSFRGLCCLPKMSNVSFGKIFCLTRNLCAVGLSYE